MRGRHDNHRRFEVPATDGSRPLADGRLCGDKVSETYSREWVKHEILRSYELKMGILAIDIHNVRDPLKGTDVQGRNPLEHWRAGDRQFTSMYRTYDWIRDDGYNNIGGWIEQAARVAGR